MPLDFPTLAKHVVLRWEMLQHMTLFQWAVPRATSWRSTGQCVSSARWAATVRWTTPRHARHAPRGGPRPTLPVSTALSVKCRFRDGNVQLSTPNSANTPTNARRHNHHRHTIELPVSPHTHQRQSTQLPMCFYTHHRRSTPPSSSVNTTN